ncbi:Sperm-associated antigen 17 [Anthophora quadrimaculata]
MQKKKRASKSETTDAKTRKQPDENAWREPLEAILINDDEWWCIVTMMVETITEHSRCVSVFNAAAEEGRRKAIYSLSCQKALVIVKTLSKQSLDKCPTIQGVCHYASKLLNEDNDALPTWLMARIIKYLIYRAREESIGIVKRLADLDREIDEEYWIMQTVADWGQPGGKKFDAEKFDSKANTKLRKRGEEWRNAVYVDDAPVDGPNLYIILTGFHDPNLPEHLVNVGVPLRCMLQIKRPMEQLDRSVLYNEERSNMKKLQFMEQYNVSKVKLFNFWTKVKEHLMDPEAHPEYSDVAFLVFCPPQLPQNSSDEEYEVLKKDMYDRLSYILYDFYDLFRQHGSYLKSMKLESGIIEENIEKSNTEIYKNFLDTIPPECASVPLILFAILLQVEANSRRSIMENSIDEKGDARPMERSSLDTESEAEASNQSPSEIFEQKLKTLNFELDLDGEESSIDNSEQNVSDIELILHGDSMNEVIHLLNDSAIARSIPKATDLMDNILPIFRHPNITRLLEQHEISDKKLNKYSRHIDKIRRYFDVIPSIEEMRHYLHVLMFDKMIFGKVETLDVTTDGEMEDVMYRQNSTTFPMKRYKSLPSLTSKSMPEANFLSDGNIDYGKIFPEIIECSCLFDLIDPRELLLPGYLEENVFKMRMTDKLQLEDFNDVELLSKTIFLQLLHKCLHSFDHMEYRYFEPTDSLLLYFGNKWRINGVRKEERMSSIRTPVRLRDFCKYVVPEEEDWLRQEEEMYRLQMAESMERLMRKSTEIYDETMLFRDEDFILAGSLKAQDLEKSKEFDQQKSTLETDVPSDLSIQETVRSKKKGKEKEKEEKGSKKKKKSDRSTSPQTVSKKSVEDEKKTLSIHSESKKEVVYDFIGYELGQLRVQITNIKKTFYSADGTLIGIETDDWLYKNKYLRITVTLRGYSLRLFHRINNPETNEIFHLTSKKGIILAFQKLSALQNVSNNSFEHNWQDMNVDIRASWPTGLLIKPIIGDGPQNPYYIQQSYILNERSEEKENREVCRKFLRNGTVLKYLDNGTVIVLRPNGAIVTCTAFEKFGNKQNAYNNKESRSSKDVRVNSSGDKQNKETKLAPKAKKKLTSPLKTQLLEAAEENPTSVQQNSTMKHDSILSMEDNTVKVSRYTVLNHDGGRYEVLDDLVVSEQHRLLVRMASDYEVDEKFTRRADGTNMLLKSNGELIVRFPDGTRITTGYTIEKEPVMCDWTEEEILLYFTSYGGREDEEGYVSFSNLSDVEDAASTSWRRNVKEEEKITEVLIADSFLSVLLTCRTEHKNYATVSYDQSAVSCTLSMPDDLRVSISRRGHYEVSMADGVNLKIDEDTLSLKGNACSTCDSQSTSVYNFHPLKTSPVIFTTTDVYGNVFKVNGDGSTYYCPRTQMNKRQRRNSNMDSVQLKKEVEQYRESDAEKEIFEDICDHERLRFEANNLNYRIFSMNRDLTAYEYIHRFERNQEELMALYDDKTSMILYPGTHRPQLHRLITYQHVGTVSLTKTALSFPDYEVKPTNFDRTDLLRSTYSIPYDWLFPFGRNGNGIWKNTHDLPLMSEAEELPELLRIRILRGFKEPGGNAVIDLQRALGSYWISVSELMSFFTKLLPDVPITLTQLDTKLPYLFTLYKLVRGILQLRGIEETWQEEKPKSVYDEIEANLNALSLGIKKTIDVETYKIGLQKPWKTPKPKPRRKSMVFDKVLKHKAIEKETLDWYKYCMRTKFILPYFQNTQGSCFLLIMNCLENAMGSVSTCLSECRGGLGTMSAQCLDTI